MSIRHQIQSYFSFLKRSTNQHGVHSPFVYDLVTKCFYNSKKESAYKAIKAYQKRLRQNKTTIKVTDLGAGSQVFKSNSRTISQITKVAGSNYKEAKLLYRLASYFKPNTILELGTSLGVATQALALGSPEANITTVEGCPNISEAARDQFKHFYLNNITLKTGDFKTVIQQLDSQITYDLIYCDGNHNKQATLYYFEALLPKTHNDSILIFDDIYWSKDMTEAWETIKKHPKVTVTIDTYAFGFVFFRQEQAKEHFTIRL